MIKFITRTVLLLLCAAMLSACSPLYNLVRSIISLPFDMIDSVL